MKTHQDPIFLPQVKCPSCGTLSNINYCSNGGTFTWWCSNDLCGKQYKFTINEDWSIESEPTGTIITRTKVTLKISPKKEDIFIVLKGISLNGNHNDEYFYDSHTCPVNLIQDGIEVRIGSNKDPHGIFEYMKTEKLEVL